MRTTHLEEYLHVKVIASDFLDFEKLQKFIEWQTMRIATTEILPHSFHLCINNYHLKDELQDTFMILFLTTLSQLIVTLTDHC